MFTGLVEAVETKLGQLAESQKALRDAEEALADARAEALAALPGSVVDAHFDGRDLAFLARVGRRFSSLPATTMNWPLFTSESGEISSWRTTGVTGQALANRPLRE